MGSQTVLMLGGGGEEAGGGVERRGGLVFGPPQAERSNARSDTTPSGRRSRSDVAGWPFQARHERSGVMPAATQPETCAQRVSWDEPFSSFAPLGVWRNGDDQWLPPPRRRTGPAARTACRGRPRPSRWLQA